MDTLLGQGAYWNEGDPGVLEGRVSRDALTVDGSPHSKAGEYFVEIPQTIVR